MSSSSPSAPASVMEGAAAAAPVRFLGLRVQNMKRRQVVSRGMETSLPVRIRAKAQVYVTAALRSHLPKPRAFVLKQIEQGCAAAARFSPINIL